jgi:hypothetical protein
MSYHQPFQVTGFHSCDRKLGLRLLNGSDDLRPSNNPWDWLGPGIYFWEQNPYRALSYAEEAVRKYQKFSGKIKTPFVVGAMIDLGKCLNLIEPRSINIVKKAYVELLASVGNKVELLPQNQGANFTDRLHIELCVLNPQCIKGYFLPRPVQLFNPYLQQQFRA